MKQSPQMQRIQNNMRPGKISLHGFLGADTRNLIDILTEDEADVQRLNLDHSTIAKKMHSLFMKGKEGLGEFVPVPPCFRVRVESIRGKLPCPFEHPGLYRKINITVKNLNLNKEITYTALGLHLIEAHGFYGGRGSPYRLNPKELAQILEIESAEE
jgi:hypothetical protein